MCSQLAPQHQKKQSVQSQDSNPGLLGVRRERNPLRDATPDFVDLVVVETKGN